ncbi:MAG: FecR domain-containing protein [Acidobacteria bacterium]|nr:FecR domain-containing protein [Acidobacteriota bacterium]
MRNSIKFLIATFATLLLAAFLDSSATAQHLVSSKAGFVNNAYGKVFILRQDSEDGEKGRASLGTQMREGDRLSTETGSMAEVLLNPGSYIRINEKTEVRAVNTAFSQVRFELIKGSVIVEVGEVEKKAPIEIITPHGSLFITKAGLQRIDARGEMTSVAVRQGEIYLGTLEQVLANNAFKVGRGKVAQLTGAKEPLLAKIDKDTIDNFDLWSFKRAETLMAANVMALRQSRRSGALAYGWLFDPFSSCYTFIPRRGAFWSPYGFGFFNAYGSCYTCSYWPYGYGYGGYGYGGRGGGTGGGNNPPPRVIAGVDRAPVRREIEGRAVNTVSGVDSGSRSSGGDFGSSRSISSPPTSSSTSTVSSPAPSRGDSGSSGGGGRSLPGRP